MNDTDTTTLFELELNEIEARHNAALVFLKSLSVQPSANLILVAADYALQGAVMRSYDPGADDMRRIAQALEALHE